MALTASPNGNVPSSTFFTPTIALPASDRTIWPGAEGCARRSTRWAVPFLKPANTRLASTWCSASGSDGSLREDHLRCWESYERVCIILFDAVHQIYAPAAVEGTEACIEPGRWEEGLTYANFGICPRHCIHILRPIPGHIVRICNHNIRIVGQASEEVDMGLWTVRHDASTSVDISLDLSAEYAVAHWKDGLERTW